MRITDEKPFTLILQSAREYNELEDDCFGLCINCGMDHYCCEPDAEKYYCSECEENMVYGLLALMEMGKILFES